MSLEIPNWNSWQDRDLYKKLFYSKINRPLTEEEDNFCTIMYHFEEFANRLDGD